VVGWQVCAERDETILQAMLDNSPPAVWYYSDLFAHTPMPDKSETYRVEGVNAELRHYLARLVRQSRCFSRCIRALCQAIKLFVFAWNRRQLYRQHYPHYPAHLIDFVCP
jgi:IS1 family transposase